MTHVFTPHAGWFRLFDYGLHYKTPHAVMLFSERNGYMRPFLSLFGYRLFLLRP